MVALRVNGKVHELDVSLDMPLPWTLLWAWTPGAGRTTPPLSHAKLVETLEAWVTARMPCPSGG